MVVGLATDRPRCGAGVHKLPTQTRLVRRAAAALARSQLSLIAVAATACLQMPAQAANGFLVIARVLDAWRSMQKLRGALSLR